MQIYDKKLLEQEVKTLLTEQSSDCAPKDNRDWVEKTWEFLPEIFFGMESSWDQLIHIIDLVGHANNSYCLF